MLSGAGIDSWGVDYGLLDASGALLGNPVHYRDGRTEGVTVPVPAAELYAVTGIQYLPFNTIYQVAAAPGGRVGQAYQATGNLVAEDDTVVLTPGALLAYATYTTQRDSGPARTYPRVGTILLTHVTDQNGAVLTGPTLVTSASSR